MTTRRLALGVLLIFVLTGSAWADTLCANLTTVQSTGICNNAFVQQIFPRATGTGLIDPFEQVAPGGSPTTEQAFNTNAAPNKATKTTLGNDLGSSANFNHALLLTDVPIFVGGQTSDGFQLPGPATQLYLQFMLDINEAKNEDPALISLDEMAIFLSNSATNNPDIAISGDPPAGLGTLIYDLDAGLDRWIALNYALNTGSGSGDIFYYVPITQAQIDACNAGGTCYVYLYSRFGVKQTYAGGGDVQGGVTDAPAGYYGTDDGFEEWAVLEGAPPPIIPEPATLLLTGSGLLGLGAWRRRRQKRQA